MNKERIDSLFEVLNFGDIDEYKMYQEIQVFFSMEGYNGETLSNFMQDIEKRKPKAPTPLNNASGGEGDNGYKSSTPTRATISNAAAVLAII